MVCQMDSIELGEEGAVCVLTGEHDRGRASGVPGRWIDIGSGEVTVDSAADESCWPADEGGAFEVRPSQRKIILKTASGQSMKHFGEKEVTFKDQSSGEMWAWFFK